MYFYWKICYFGHFLYTTPGQPGGAKTLSGGAGPPPGPTLATALQCEVLIIQIYALNVRDSVLEDTDTCTE